MVLIVRRAATIGCWAVIVAASLLAMSSYVAYTTVGFDFEIPTARGVDVFYYRLRWDDGSTWAGLAVQPHPHPARALDWFDPGGTILARPTRPVHRHRCNDLGFWWINSPADDPYVAARYHGATFSTWWDARHGWCCSFSGSDLSGGLPAEEASATPMLPKKGRT